jgi:hypothetical protein
MIDIKVILSADSFKDISILNYLKAYLLSLKLKGLIRSLSSTIVYSLNIT